MWYNTTYIVSAGMVDIFAVRSKKDKRTEYGK